VNDSQGLGYSHAGLFLREPIQSFQYRLDLAVPQQLLRELLCDVFRVVADYYRKRRSLSRPLPICFFATASIEINSTIIFATISVISGSKEISE
jgi:hypothetical protein